MRKLLFIAAIIFVLVFLPGCFVANKNGQYSASPRLVNQSLTVQKNNQKTGESSFAVYYVSPSSVSVEGMVQVRIYGTGFLPGAKIFIDRPGLDYEAAVINPGSITAWLPPHYEGYVKIGVINPNGKTAYWQKLLKYIQE